MQQVPVVSLCHSMLRISTASTRVCPVHGPVDKSLYLCATTQKNVPSLCTLSAASIFFPWTTMDFPIHLWKCKIVAVYSIFLFSNSLSSLFFWCSQLKPDSHRKKFKTSIKWRNLNPVFNEEFMFESRPNDFDKQFLIITVWDKDFGKSNDFLGSLMLGPTSKGRRLKQWRDCVRLPDHYHEQWHCLSADPAHWAKNYTKIVLKIKGTATGGFGYYFQICTNASSTK